MERVMPEFSQRSDDNARATVTEEATRRIAAAIICNPDFPAEHLLPRLAPIPHGTLEQQILLDYDLLTKLLWGAETYVREQVKKNNTAGIGTALSIMTFLGCMCVSLFVVSKQRQPEPQVMLIGGIVGFVIAAFVFRYFRSNINQLIADARADYLKDLMDGITPKAVEEFQKTIGRKNAIAWHDGSMDPNTIPVLVMLKNNDPFPGYGRHQARELFLCRPKADRTPSHADAEVLQAEVSQALIRMVGTTGIASVISGQVVLMDGDTLTKNSPWLESDEWDMLTRPPITLKAKDLVDIHERDPRASVRIYTCIQAVVPQYSMCLTFFVRTFLAGNSAACEVNVCTLGPPVHGWDFVRDKLRAHKREGRVKTFNEENTEEKRPEKLSHLGARLENVRFSVENSSMIFRNPMVLYKLDEIKPFDEDALKHEKTQVKAITKNSDLWPGLFTSTTNWREAYSLVFTEDFFGNTESRAILRTLFDRISRAALSSMKELNYDISDYQDDNGKFNINAEKIEQLVLGENVKVNNKKRKKDKDADNEAKPAANVGESGAA
jgi:hypothetical protein